MILAGYMIWRQVADWTSRENRLAFPAMNRLVLSMAMVLLVVFAASIVAHEARASIMATSQVGMAGDMADCDGYPLPGEGKMPYCVQVCLAPFAALPAAAIGEFLLVAIDEEAVLPGAMSGIGEPPDPHPPRTIIPD
jgi:hypothetical protein